MLEPGCSSLLAAVRRDQPRRRGGLEHGAEAGDAAVERDGQGAAGAGVARAGGRGGGPAALEAGGDAGEEPAQLGRTVGAQVGPGRGVVGHRLRPAAGALAGALGDGPQLLAGGGGHRSGAGVGEQGDGDDRDPGAAHPVDQALRVAQLGGGRLGAGADVELAVGEPQQHRARGAAKGGLTLLQGLLGAAQRHAVVGLVGPVAPGSWVRAAPTSASACAPSTPPQGTSGV